VQPWNHLRARPTSSRSATPAPITMPVWKRSPIRGCRTSRRQATSSRPSVPLPGSPARRRRFDRNEIVFHRDDPGDSLHLIEKGRFAFTTGRTRSGRPCMGLSCTPSSNSAARTVTGWTSERSGRGSSSLARANSEGAYRQPEMTPLRTRPVPLAPKAHNLALATGWAP